MFAACLLTLRGVIRKTNPHQSATTQDSVLYVVNLEDTRIAAFDSIGWASLAPVVFMRSLRYAACAYYSETIALDFNNPREHRVELKFYLFALSSSSRYTFNAHITHTPLFLSLLNFTIA